MPRLPKKQAAGSDLAKGKDHRTRTLLGDVLSAVQGIAVVVEIEVLDIGNEAATASAGLRMSGRPIATLRADLTLGCSAKGIEIACGLERVQDADAKAKDTLPELPVTGGLVGTRLATAVATGASCCSHVELLSEVERMLRDPQGNRIIEVHARKSFEDAGAGERPVVDSVHRPGRGPKRAPSSRARRS
jgi:hypothetical protein